MGIVAPYSLDRAECYMAIMEFNVGPNRKTIGFVGDLPEEARKVFNNLGYTVYLVDESTTSLQLQMSCALVLSQIADKPLLVRADLEKYLYLIDHGCMLYIRYINDPEARQIVIRALNRNKAPTNGLLKDDKHIFQGDWYDSDAPIFGPFVQIVREDESWEYIANIIINNPVGCVPHPDLKIVVFDSQLLQTQLKPEFELLLKRAFSDCSEIHLYAKMDGLSGVGAYEGYANFRNTVTGSTWPYHVFIKIGERVKVAREFNNFRTIALERVPYHLGPRLKLDRCVLGHTCGLIVSDFVGGAEPIRDCAMQGRSIAAIGNLFNVTLLAWRRSAIVEERSLQEFILTESLKKTKKPPHRQPLIAEFGVSDFSIEEIIAAIKNTTPSTPVLTGVVHGDLHATNVLVRLNDAVIIDLEKVKQNWPILYDVASLEAGLLVDGFIGDKRSIREVYDSIKSLYQLDSLETQDHHCQPSNKSSWFFESARQIRMQARQMELKQLQYAWVLGAVLLHKGCNPNDFTKDGEVHSFDGAPTTRESVRALACVVGEQILMALANKFKK